MIITIITCLNFYFTDSFQEIITCLNFYFTDSFQELRVFDLNPSASMEGRILSKRDNPKFSHNGYLYVFDKRSKKDTSIKFWRCENKNECKARIHTKNDEVTKELNHHSHGSSAASVEVAEIKTSIKRRAGESQEQPSTIINFCTENVSQDTQGALPKLDAMKQIVREKKKQNGPRPTKPYSCS